MLATTAAALVLSGHRGSAQQVGAAQSGPLLWPFLGSAAVADRDGADALARFPGASARYVLPARAGGQVFAHVGKPHVLFAATDGDRGLDVLVLVAPVTGAGPVVGLAAFYANDSSHHGFDTIVPLAAGDVEVSGDVGATGATAPAAVTVVVGGPRAGGLLVDVDGVPQNVTTLAGSQTVVDQHGIAWLYPVVRPTPSRPGDGVLTLVNGALDIAHVLYHGPPGVSTGSG